MAEKGSFIDVLNMLSIICSKQISDKRIKLILASVETSKRQIPYFILYHMAVSPHFVFNDYVS